MDMRVLRIYINPPFFTKSKIRCNPEICDSDGKIHKVKHLAYDDTFDRSIGTIC